MIVEALPTQKKDLINLEQQIFVRNLLGTLLEKIKVDQKNRTEAECDQGEHKIHGKDKVGRPIVL